LSEAARYGEEFAGVNVMGSGTIDIGNNIQSNSDGARFCGAMAQQRRADGSDENGSTPQKFVHLVGCRDPNARKIPWTRPRPPAPKT
jgi:hypothetical protein